MGRINRNAPVASKLFANVLYESKFGFAGEYTKEAEKVLRKMRYPYNSILRCIYIKMLSVRQTAGEMNYTPLYVIKLKNKGLRQAEEILKNNE